VSKARFLGTRPADAVTLVEPPVSRVYARRARLAFWSVASAVGVLVAMSAAGSRPLPLAVVAGVVAAAVCGLAVAVLVRVWPVLRVLWHWSAEIATAGILAAIASSLSSATRPAAVPVGAAALAAVVWLVRPLRRRLVAWVWCAVVRHRLRLCFAEFIRSAVRVRPGSTPLILVARPTPAGERVWVWLRPGLELADLENRTGKLAVACWAGEVRVVRASARYAALLRMDVTRRDPLAAMVASPLAGLFTDASDADVPVAPDPPPLGLDLPDVPEEVPDPRGRVRVAG